MPRRLFFHIAFWLGCFAVLMMHLGPLISGAQGIMVPVKPYQQQLMQEHRAEPLILSADAEHADHHAMMGHKPNQKLPDWVNNLNMCGYCELLTLSPALMLALLCALFMPPVARPVRCYTATFHTETLQSHACPRAPPLFA